jgi:hypothetical protein
MAMQLDSAVRTCSDIEALRFVCQLYHQVLSLRGRGGRVYM